MHCSCPEARMPHTSTRTPTRRAICFRMTPPLPGPVILAGSIDPDRVQPSSCGAATLWPSGRSRNLVSSLRTSPPPRVAPIPRTSLRVSGVKGATRGPRNPPPHPVTQPAARRSPRKPTPGRVTVPGGLAQVSRAKTNDAAPDSEEKCADERATYVTGDGVRCPGHGSLRSRLQPCAKHNHGTLIPSV